MKTDILKATDNRKAGVRLLLDLSAAIDTVDHDMMCHRLDICLELRSKPLAWFRSCLTPRSDCVSVDDSLFEIKLIFLFVVPQGLVLDLCCLSFYTLL